MGGTRNLLREGGLRRLCKPNGGSRLTIMRNSTSFCSVDLRTRKANAWHIDKCSDGKRPLDVAKIFCENEKKPLISAFSGTQHSALRSVSKSRCKPEGSVPYTSLSPSVGLIFRSEWIYLTYLV